jgi:hypothetical protein
LEDQITIHTGDRDPRESLGEPERQLFFKSRLSRELSVVLARCKSLEPERQLFF